MEIPKITAEQQESIDKMDCSTEHRNHIARMFRDERIERANPNHLNRLSSVNTHMKMLAESIEFGTSQDAMWRSGELIVALTQMVEEYNVAKEQFDIAGRFQAIRVIAQQTSFN